MEKQHCSILFTFIGLLHLSYGCSIEGVDNWLVPQTREIIDTFKGVLFSGTTQNIQDIISVTQREGLNKGPYVDVSLENSQFVIATNADFEKYENFETQTNLGYTISLRCTDSSVRVFVFIINITDTNNNDPIFLPTSKYQFTIAPPVPPGFLVTTCFNDILVRDIDLTTQKIDFKIEGSDLFKISYDPTSKVPKEFKARLETTDLIRSIAEPIILTVFATDVDLTEGPPRTTSATVVISADSQFEFPDEPIFSQPFYLADYKTNEVILQHPISLRQGYDDQVKFSFDSDHSEYFELVPHQNNLSFKIKSPIPIDLYSQRQIYLVVKATREHTSGATSTVILRLPEETPLEFENAIYEGTITDNVLHLTDLKLRQGYEGLDVTVDINSEYPFRANIDANVIRISMDPLATEVIQNNNFINLQIAASNNRTTAVTVVTLEIIKDDYTTPVFESNFYNGSYSTEEGLTLEQIVLTQGYDKTVKIALEGKHFQYLNITQDGPRITLSSSTIPSDIFNERNILLTVLASKPRTVGAHATVNIVLPSARYLNFGKDIYSGFIENNNLTLKSVILVDGYDSDVNFTLNGEFMTYFFVKNDNNIVTIDVEKEIPETVLLENDFLVLTLAASGANTVPTSTSIVLQIIKEDHRTPVFSENLYSLKYENDELSLGNISLVQGFDKTVTFDLTGEHLEYFAIEPTHNFINMVLKSPIPEEVIFNEKIIILNIEARKPRTVGANAAVYITFSREMIEPTVMSFSQNAYNGFLKGGNLNVDDIVLQTGYSTEIKFILSGEYSENFLITNSSNVVKIIPANDWSLEDLEENNIIILEVEATRERAIPAKTVIVIDILKTVRVPPIFEKAFYSGTYTSVKGLLFEDIMSLKEGFDNTVEFSLEEEFSKWFKLEQNENSINLRVNTTNPIPEEIIENNQHLFFTIIAYKPGTTTGRAVIYIDLPIEDTSPTILRFDKRQYTGLIENGTLKLENIRLMDTNVSLAYFNLTGEFSNYFMVSNLTDAITIELLELPKEVIENNTLIILNIEASKVSAISGHATIVLEIIRNEEQVILPIFEEAFYTGQYFNSTGLVFPSPMKLAQGFDETVSFGLMDEDAKWFSLIHNGPNNLILRLKDEGLNEITGRSHLVFTVVANKTNSLSARAAVIISLMDNNNISVLQFEQTSYVGYIENQILHIENLRLLDENILSIDFNITGDYSSYFSISKYSDFVQINLMDAPSEMIEANDVIVLNLEASQVGAISGHTTIVVKIIKGLNITKPVFSETYYTGEYSQESDLIFKSSITLLQGYDKNVTFELEDDDSKWFSLVQEEPNNFGLKIKNYSINEIVGRSHLLFTVVANKINSTSARAAIVISLLGNSNVRILQFEQTSYLGNLENRLLEIEEIRLLSGISSSTKFNITGDYASYFSISKLANSIKIEIIETPIKLPDNDFLILNVKALEPGAVSGHTTIVLNIVKDPGNNTVAPVFSEAFYPGSYSEENGLVFLSVITLVEGYDETVTFILDNNDSKGFALMKNGLNNYSIILNGSLSVPENRKYFLFTVIAQKPNTNNGRAAIIISIARPSDIDDVSFDRTLYNGKLHDGVLSHDEITLTGFKETDIVIIGEHNHLFKSELTNGVVKVKTSGAEIPRDLTYIALELQASSASAVLLIDVSFSEPPEIEIVSFDRTLYNGKLHNGVLSHDVITLTGFKETKITITGEYNYLFKSQLTNGIVKIETSGTEIPRHLTYIALQLQAANASAVLLIDVSFSDPPEIDDVSFDRTLYNGKLHNGVLSHDEITLTGFKETNIIITGEYKDLFKSQLTNGIVKIETSGTDIPRHLTYIALQLQAASASAVLLIDVSFSDPPEIDDVSFDRTLYNGKLHNGVLSHDEITLTGFKETNIIITGEYKDLFKSQLTNGIVKIETSGTDIPRHLTYIALQLQAASASAVLLIDVSFSDPPEIDDVSFDRTLYNGKLHNGVLSHDEITLTGFKETNIIITGEYKDLFKSQLTNGIVKIETSGTDIPRHLTYIALQLQAASASAVLLIDVSFSDPPEIDDVSFDRTLYNGKLHNGVLSHDEITLTGFKETNIIITGEYKNLFKSQLTNGIVKIETSGTDIPRHLTYIALQLQAASASAVLLIDVSFSDPPEIDDVSFDRTLYNGKLHNGVLSHDEITLTGFKESNIIITGEYNDLFKSQLTNGIVKIETSGTDIPRHLTYIALQLQAASASAVLLIDVSFSENPELPIVSFKSHSYFLWADEEQSGVVGAVEATADNGEAIVYSLRDINEHIQSRIKINSNGEVLLTAALDKGMYTFTAVATSIESKVQATAPVLLRVDNLPECSDEVGLSPLIVLERLEEEPHLNLVVLNQTEHKGCQYTLSNIFPKEQSWLYIDNFGLHAKVIDREDESIASMTLSQIQVELTLECDSDEVQAFSKRSLDDRTQFTEDRTLYSYEDSPNKWVLTDTISFNAKRSFVNLIVKDINDNSPIFLGKGNEPIYVGYPVSELENTVLPRALAELKATDADIGENAAIIYWSEEDNLAVSPNTGLVHVRNNAELENNSRLTIYAIDQNGKGRSGTLDIVVKLLDKNQIAVLTIRNAFLEDEVHILNELSIAVGYEIKVLKAVVISNNNEELQRKKRDIAGNSRASLQLYVYGLWESEPVDINQLTRDINNSSTATVNIAGIVSLDEHLEDLRIRSAGLLASTISLAVLLFIILVSSAVWFIIKRRRSKNYEQFSSRTSSASQLSSANLPKIEVVGKSRADIEEIKKTERRLQEMLETPVVNPFVPKGDAINPPIEPVDDTIVNISSTDAQLPIVIQSIDKLKDTEESDDNDEFGEITKPRKSVVTFNENVEKIIHIEDVPDDESSENNFEIYKF